METEEYGPPEELTLQAVYDKVTKHLIRQGRPSIDPNLLDFESEGQACAYRGEKGTACAVGCLIPEDRYSTEWENVSIEGLSFGNYETDGSAVLPWKFFNDESILEMLKDLQTVHDNAALTKDGRFNKVKLRAHLRRIAGRFGLTATYTYWSPDRADYPMDCDYPEIIA